MSSSLFRPPSSSFFLLPPSSFFLLLPASFLLPPSPSLVLPSSLLFILTVVNICSPKNLKMCMSLGTRATCLYWLLCFGLCRISDPSLDRALGPELWGPSARARALDREIGSRIRPERSRESLERSGKCIFKKNLTHQVRIVKEILFSRRLGLSKYRFSRIVYFQKEFNPPSVFSRGI